MYLLNLLFIYYENYIKKESPLKLSEQQSHLPARSNYRRILSLLTRDITLVLCRLF